jgi:hypothetical protein
MSVRGRQPRFLLPALVVPGLDSVVTCPVYSESTGALEAPSGAGVLDVYDAGGTLMVSLAAPVVSSIATVTVPAATSASWSMGLGWRHRWTLHFAAAPTSEIYETSGGVVRYIPAPTVTDQYIYDRYSQLNSSDTASITTTSTWRGPRKAAHVELQRWLLKVDRRPWLILDPWALATVELELSLAYVFDDLATRLDDAYQAKADKHKTNARWEFGQLQFRYDSPGEAQDGHSSQRVGAFPQFWTVSGGLD